MATNEDARCRLVLHRQNRPGTLSSLSGTRGSLFRSTQSTSVLRCCLDASRNGASDSSVLQRQQAGDCASAGRCYTILDRGRM